MKTISRDSNFELLRIIAMIMVLILHGNFYSNGIPTIDEINSYFIPSFCRIFIQSLSIVAVNVFVLISGWFGMTFSWKNIGNILFQCFFYVFLIFLLLECITPSNISISPGKIAHMFFFGQPYWFVLEYLGLMVVSPLLNVFVEKSTKNELKSLLIAYFCFQWVYGWIFDDFIGFKWGYSTYSFIGLYLLIRYIRKFKPVWSQQSMKKFFLLYVMLAIFSTILYLFITIIDIPFVVDFFRNKILSYNSPLVILSAIFFILAFSKLNLSNRKFINLAGASSFAIYLIHCHPLLFSYYAELMRFIFQNYKGIEYLTIFITILLVISIICILIDCIRIYLWKTILNYAERIK